MSDFVCQVIRSWDDFNDSVRKMSLWKTSEVWLYRGQPQNWQLRTTIERALDNWGIPLEDATSIEFQTIREFRRRLRQPEYDRLQKDTMHCLALMQHHRAPTRLLDCTYSPFVAAAFAMENGIFPLPRTDRPPRQSRRRESGDRGHQGPVVWCFNGHWCEKEAKKKLPLNQRTLIGRRNDDAQRNDETFNSLFQIKSSRTTGAPRWKFVKSETPLHLNERLTAQQGAFLCPADLSSTFVDNLKAMDGWKSKRKLLKLCLQLSKDEAGKFARNLKDMNISFAALFPGLDGFGMSINQQIGHYRELARQQAGLG